MRPNQLYVIISLALVLLLLGLVGLWTFQAGYLTKQLREDLDVVVELEADHTAVEREQLIAYLRTADFHRAGSEPEYITKAAALAEMGDDIRRDLAELGLNNPLLDVVTFNVPLKEMGEARLAEIATDVQAQPGVAGVYYQDSFVDRIAGNARRMTWILIGLAVLFALVAGLLIHNTVRLSLYANRFTIKTQELVGATWGFISRPYLLRSLAQGLASGLLAVAAVVGLQFWLNDLVPELRLFAHPVPLVVLYAGIVLLGVTINFISHYVVVRRYLRLRLDDLY